MPNIPSLRQLLLSASALVVSSAAAQDIPIVNAGFESVSRTLAEGEQTNGVGGSGTLVATRSPFPFGGGAVNWSAPVTVPGWHSRTVPFGSDDVIFAGVLRPTDVGGTPFITGIEGDNALSIQASIVGQATAATLQPNTTYTLSFLGGISEFDSDYFFAVSLTAIDAGVTLPTEGQTGVTRLELGRFFLPTQTPDGLMRRYEFSYTSPEVLPTPLVGTNVGINLFGSDGLPRVIYDDFVLTAAPVPAPGAVACLAALLLLRIKERARADSSKSQATEE